MDKPKLKLKKCSRCGEEKPEDTGYYWIATGKSCDGESRSIAACKQCRVSEMRSKCACGAVKTSENSRKTKGGNFAKKCRKCELSWARDTGSKKHLKRSVLDAVQAGPIQGMSSREVHAQLEATCEGLEYMSVVASMASLTTRGLLVKDNLHTRGTDTIFRTMSYNIVRFGNGWISI